MQCFKRLLSQTVHRSSGRILRLIFLNFLKREHRIVRLDKETFGDTNCFVELDSPDEGEGSLLPRQIRGRAICPGKFHILLRAVDSLSGQQIPNVSPIDLISKMIADVLIKEFQGSLYCCVQVPGTPPVPGAVSMYRLPELLRMRRNLWLVEL